MPADDTDSYVTAEARARRNIDEQLRAAGWAVQDIGRVNLAASRGVAIREVTLERGHGRVDYLLYVDRLAVGLIEAKREGTPLVGVEWQSARYTEGLPPSLPAWRRPLPLVYESTGVETRFTNLLDPAPRSRPVFTFQRPETLAARMREAEQNPDAPTLRHRLQHMPPVDPAPLRPAQYDAVVNLEQSLAADRPRALAQMTMGAGKTYMAVTETYRLLKHAGARRVLFLVDRATLGRQAQREFAAFATPDDGRKFTELYNVQRMTTNRLDPSASVVITTIQRLYSMLRGEEDLPAELDEESPEQIAPERPVEVSYNRALPPETFDMIVVDECHRSIYGVWRQVLNYFDAYITGLTATPSKQTFGFFNQNLVSSYTHEQAVADRVNVDFEVYRIRTEIGEAASSTPAPSPHSGSGPPDGSAGRSSTTTCLTPSANWIERSSPGTSSAPSSARSRSDCSARSSRAGLPSRRR
jgi:type I restriction enzyme, R subunit